LTGGRRLTSVIAVLLAFAASVALPSAAYGRDDRSAGKTASSHRELSALERAQLPLTNAADRIHQLVEQNRWTGYAGSAIQLRDKAVLLYWKGEIPRQMADELRQLRRSVNVVVKTVAHSLSELDREARRIAQQNLGTVTEVGPTEDFTGLRVVIDESATAAARERPISSSIPLTFSTGQPLIPAYWRWGDTSPFWGGAVIDHLVNPVLRIYSYCTTGFAARKSNGQEAMITAKHCSDGNLWDWRTPETDSLVGRNESGSTPLDATVLTGGDYSAQIYVGAHNSSDGALVRGSGNPADNSFVFASGGFSGASVLQVRGVNTYVNGPTFTTGPGFWTEDADRQGSVGEGDSGGPVVQANADFTVTARGMIDILDYGGSAAPCLGVDAGRKCGWRSFHVNIDQIASGLGLSIQTS
jgi:hypothetical protein